MKDWSRAEAGEVHGSGLGDDGKVLDFILRKTSSLMAQMVKNLPTMWETQVPPTLKSSSPKLLAHLTAWGKLVNTDRISRTEVICPILRYYLTPRQL